MINFETWDDVLHHVRQGLPIYYQAPLDAKPVLIGAAVRVHVASIGLDRWEKTYTVRVTPPHWSDTDPFSADSGHLERFRREE